MSTMITTQEEEHEVEIKEEMAEEIKGCHDEAEAKQIQILVGVEEETMKWMQISLSHSMYSQKKFDHLELT